VLCLSTLAFVEFAAGDLKASNGALARMQAHAESLGARDVVHDRSEPFHIESLVALGELDRAREVLARLDERGRVLPRLWIWVTLPRARALVLAGEGDVPAALHALDDVDVELASRLPFELGWTLLLKGRLLRRTRQKRAAADALTQAVAVFEGLGAPAWIDQARGELQRVGLRPPAPDKFTESERCVAELVAKGPHQPRGGGTAVHEPEDRRGDPRADLSQARHPLARGARSTDREQPGWSRTNAGKRPITSRRPCG